MRQGSEEGPQGLGDQATGRETSQTWSVRTVKRKLDLSGRKRWCDSLSQHLRLKPARDTLRTRHPPATTWGVPFGESSWRSQHPSLPTSCFRPEGGPEAAGFWVLAPEREGMGVPAPPLALL